MDLRNESLLKAREEQAQTVGGIAAAGYGKESPAQEEKARTILLRYVREAKDAHIRKLTALQGIEDEINMASDYELKLIKKFQELTAAAQ